MSPRPVLFVSLALIAGCEELPATDGCDVAASGDLVVELPTVALDEAVSAVVLDASGAEFARFSETTTLEELEGGTWHVVTERGLRYEAPSRIDTAHGALHDTVVPVCVGGEPVTVSLTVEPQPSSGHLWLTTGVSLVAFSAGTLEAGADLAPDTRVDVRLVNDFRGIAFDPSGNLWAATSPTYGTRLLMFRPDQLEGSGEQVAALAISAGEDDGTQIADLWVDADGTVWTLVRFSFSGFTGLQGWTRADLLAGIEGGGELTVAPSIVHELPELAGAEDLLAVGDDLFVSVFSSNRVFRYDRAALAGTMRPSAEIRFVDARDIEQYGPTELAVSAGQLWVTLWTALQIVPFAPTADGPVLVDPLTTGVTDLPGGLDADATGTVWWGNADVSGATELHRFDGATGAPGPTRVVPALDAPKDLLFDPIAR